jgi:hypothetical protein
MNDFAYLMDVFREDPVSLGDIAEKLARLVCGSASARQSPTPPPR